MSDLGPKALACLRLAAEHNDLSFQEWEASYRALCEEFSEKAVTRMYESLSDRGYIEYGVSARMGWPTDKGRAVLG